MIYLGIMFDVILVLIVVVFIITSAKRGFLLSLLDLGAYIISLLVAMFSSKYLARLIFNLFIKNPVQTRVEDGLKAAAGKTLQEQTETIVSKIPKFIVDVWSDTGSAISKEIESHGNSSAAYITDKIIEPVVNGLIGAILFFIIFFVVLVFTKWLARIISKVLKLPVAKQINMTLGGVFGFFKGSIAVLCILAVFSFVNSSFPLIQRETIATSYITDPLIKNNPVSKTISNIFE